MAEDPVQHWIRRIGTGQSLVDIGGIGELSINERVSQALAAGCLGVAMADIQPFSSHYWVHFYQLMEQRGITRDRFASYERIDIRAHDLPALLPKFDIVHSTGILYHLPDPATALWNLIQVSNRWLIINTVITPQVVENERGRVALPDGAGLFLPGLSEQERAVLQLRYQTKFGWDLNFTSPRVTDREAAMPHMDAEGRLSPWPYWWLFTIPAFRALAELMHLRIHDEWTWEEHCHFMLCEKG